MASLIEVNVFESKDGRFLVSSVEVAEKFEKDHKNILRDIRETYADSDWGRLNFELSSYKNSQGKKQPCYQMTRDGFSILVMGFTGEKSLDWKIKFLAAFTQMEQEIYRLKGKEWIHMRLNSKSIRRIATDAIQEYIDYAISQGSEKYKACPKYAFSNFTKMEYKVLFGISQVEKDFRDTLSIMDLNSLIMAERIVESQLLKMMEEGIHYKEIYRVIKLKVEQLSELAPSKNNIGNPFAIKEINNA